MEESHPSDLRQWSTSRVILATIVVTITVAGLWFVYRNLGLFLLLFLGVVLGMALHPAVEWLARRHIPRSLSVITIYLLLLALFGLTVYLAVPVIVEQSEQIEAQVPGYYEQLRIMLRDSPSWLIRRLAARLPPRLDLGGLTEGGSAGTASLAATFAIAEQMARATVGLLAVLILGFYWTLESRRITQYVTMLVPPDRRDAIQSLLHLAEAKVGGYMRAQAFMALVIGVLAFVSYLLIGLPYALVLAVFAGIMEVVPIVGPTIGAAPAVMVAFTISPTRGIWVALAALVAQTLQGQLLVPRIMRETVGVHQIVTLLAVAAFSTLFGFVGVLLAVPIAALIQIVLDRTVLAREANSPTGVVGRGPAGALRLEAHALAADVRRQLKTKTTAPTAETDHQEDAIEQIVHDLDRLLADLDVTGEAPV